MSFFTKMRALIAVAILSFPTDIRADQVPIGPPRPPELSTIIVPIRTTIAPLTPLLEKQVPKTFDRMGTYEYDARKNYGFRYRILRDPIALQMRGRFVEATTTLRYALEGCRRFVNPFNRRAYLGPCVSCGLGEPMREARIGVDAEVTWDAQWRLRSKTTARPAVFVNRCQVTVLNFDITRSRIAPIVDGQMQTVARTIDRNLPALTSIRPTAQQIWSALQAPASIGPRLWLLMEPADVALSPLLGKGLSVESTLALRARMRVVVGEKPAAAKSALPPLRAWTGERSGLHLPTPVEIPYGEASAMLTREIGGRTLPIEGGTLRIDDIRMGPGAPGMLRIEAQINYRAGLLKRYRGPVVFEGQPRFDANTGRVVIAHLDYALDRKKASAFVRLADRLAHDTLRTRMRAQARWSVASRLEEMKQQISAGLNRTLREGVTLHGRVDAVTAREVTPAPHALILHLLVTGKAEIVVRQWK